MHSHKDRPWEQAFEDMVYWEWEGLPSESGISSAVGFIERALQMPQGAKVLDLGCGLGYHAIELARRGYEVTALEWSQPFLEAATRRAAEAGVNVRFVRGDMTCMTFESEFDAAILWDNTFAIFPHEENVATLDGIRRALRSGGLALIDTQNYTSLPEELKQGWGFAGDDPNLLFLTQGTKNVLQARFGFDVIGINLATGKRPTMPFSWRLYLLPELERLVADAGLTLLAVYGHDPKVVDWKAWTRGEPYPYALEGFTERAAKRILLCQVPASSPSGPPADREMRGESQHETEASQ